MCDMTFVRRLFNRMLVVATLTMSVNYVVMLSASVVVGNLVGADGLAGVNTCTPVFGVASFLASLLSVGTALVFSRAMGAFDARRAASVFSQSLSLAVLLGAAIYVAMWLGEDAFLDFTGVTGAVRREAEAYWRWQSVVLALTPSVLLLEALVYADGDVVVAALAGVLHVAGSVGLAVLFTMRTGDAGGAAAGTALTMAVVLAACALHFLRRHNHLRWRLRPSWRDFGATLSASLADSTIYLCWGVLILVVNTFTVTHFGQGLLPVVALAASVVELSIVFDGVGEALIPIGGMYDGEGNRPALRELARHSAWVATAEGAVAGVILFVLAPQVAMAYGLRADAAALLPEAVAMIRSLGIAMPFMGLLMMANTHFLVVHHVPFAVSVTVMKDLVLPCAGALALGLAFGSRGMWIGFAVGYAAAAAYPFLAVRLRYGRALYPWLIARDDGQSVDFSEVLANGSPVRIGRRTADFLGRRGVSAAVAAAAADLVQAACEATSEANAAHRVTVEVFLSCEADSVRLVLRDDGRAQDVNAAIGAAERVASFRYLNTLGCNRTEYRLRAR